MKVTPDIINGEFIGTEGRIAESRHSGYVGISGQVVDESKNTFTIMHAGKAKSVIKDAAVFRFRFSDGTIVEIKHSRGKHFRAYKKESDLNEKVTIDIDSPIGVVRLVQIAGLMARRIYPYIKQGDKLRKGEKIGIIRLGSRVDVFLPANKIKNVNVKINELVYAGVTTIAEIK